MSLIRDLKPVKRAFFVNGWGIVGILLTLFMVPGDLPFWIWAASSCAALVLMNCVAFWRPTPANTKKEDRRVAGRVSRSDLIIYGGAAFLALDLIWRYFAKRQ
jgi:hypothetical protein